MSSGIEAIRANASTGARARHVRRHRRAPLRSSPPAADAWDIRDQSLICDAKDCREPATPHATYWIPGQPWIHLCREHWGMAGERREELRRLIGLKPDAPETT